MPKEEQLRADDSIIMPLNGTIYIPGKRLRQVRSSGSGGSFVMLAQVGRGGLRNGRKGGAKRNGWGQKSNKKVISESTNGRR